MSCSSSKCSSASARTFSGAVAAEEEKGAQSSRREIVAVPNRESCASAENCAEGKSISNAGNATAGRYWSCSCPHQPSHHWMSGRAVLMCSCKSINRRA